MENKIPASLQSIFTPRSKVNKLSLQLSKKHLSKNISVYINSKDKAGTLKSQFLSVFLVDQGNTSTIHAKQAESLTKKDRC